MALGKADYFATLVWGPRDQETRNLPMSRVMLSRIYRANCTTGDDSNLDVAGDVQELKRVTGMVVRYSKYDHHAGLAREVYHVQLPPALAAIIYATKSEVWREGLVNILTGLPIGHTEIAAYHRRLLAEATLRNAGSPEEVFLSYLNSMSVEQFRIKSANIASCDAWLDNLREQWQDALIRKPKYVAEAYEREYIYAKGALDRILSYPLSVYQISDRSPRLFGHGGWPTLHRELRHRLLPDLYEVDLSSAHLAIFAMLAGVRSVQAFLAKGDSIWPYLCAQCDLSFTADTKAALKILLYEILFGCLEHRLFFPKGKLTWVLLEPFTKEVQMRFLAVPLIRDILAARKQMLDEIGAKGGMVGADGRMIEIIKGSRKQNIRGMDAKSVLA